MVIAFAFFEMKKIWFVLNIRRRKVELKTARLFLGLAHRVNMLSKRRHLFRLLI